MRKTLKIVTLILCFASIFALCALSVLAENSYEDLYSGKVVTRFIIGREISCKTEYMEGEYFDPTGFKGYVFFNDGSNIVIPSDKLTYQEQGPLTADTTTVTFTFGDAKATASISVEPNPFARIVTGIELVAAKTDYLAFDTLPATAFTVKALYSNGTSETIDTSLCTFYPELGEPLSSEHKSVKATYTVGNTEYTAETAINVQPVLYHEFIGADIAYLYEGLAPDAPRGLSVTVYFDEARTLSKTLTTFDITYPESTIRANEFGKTTIGIIVDTQTVELELEVLPISGYKITGLKEAYYYGDTITLDQFRAYAIYSDGATVNITSEVSIEAPSMAVFGSKITASHNGFDLKDFLGSSIPEGTLTVINQPNKLHYEIGEIFESTGLSLAIEYSDGHRILLLPGDYTLTYSTPLTAADKFVTAEYFGAKTNVSISVGNEAYIVSLSIIGAPEVMNYYEGNVLNTSGLLIQAVFSDGTSSIIDHRTLTFTPALNTPLTTDVTAVTISANDGTDKYCEVILPITVVKKVPTALIATSMPNKLLYAEGEKFDPDGLALALIFNDMSSIVPSSFSFSPELGSSIVLLTNATEKYIIHAIYEYEGQEYRYPIEITVTPAEVESLLVSRQPVKTTYEIGDPFDPAGLELILVYKDRSLTSPTVPDGYYSFSPSVITRETKEITVTFRDLTVTVPITVSGVETVPPITTEPVPPVTSGPEETTLPPEESSTEETTADPDVTTEPETSEPEVTTDIETTTSPEDVTTEEETTTEPHTGDKDKVPSLLSLWIIVIVVIVAALIALIIYYKKNFT
ncbi:MAG: bacterial Ig-like domain-containing protein [Clostridia bacterium]|nr:bacterial Ig-like domain-containing protein [Clostridia bacterium]